MLSRSFQMRIEAVAYPASVSVSSAFFPPFENVRVKAWQLVGAVRRYITGLSLMSCIYRKNSKLGVTASFASRDLMKAKILRYPLSRGAVADQRPVLHS